MERDMDSVTEAEETSAVSMPSSVVVAVAGVAVEGAVAEGGDCRV